MNYLNLDVFNIIMDFVGINKYWKRRFTNDVLVFINKQYKFVPIVNQQPCARCYKTGIIENTTFPVCIFCVDRNNIQLININFYDFSKLEMTRSITHWRIFVDSGIILTNNAFRNCNEYNSHSKSELLNKIIPYSFKKIFSKQLYIKFIDDDN